MQATLNFFREVSFTLHFYISLVLSIFIGVKVILEISSFHRNYIIKEAQGE
jgi:hypothetical protein